MRVIREVKLGGKSWKQILGIFIAELLTSVFVGLVTFFLCESSGFKPFYTATLVSVASYMGGRALTVLEALYKARLDATKEPHDGP